MEQTCAFAGCQKKPKCRGWCAAHYERWRKHGSPDIVLNPVPPPINRIHESCTIDGCDRDHHAQGLCAAHYTKLLKYGNPLEDNRRTRNWCSVADCGKPAHGHGMCRNHWSLWRNHGDPLYAPTKYTRCIAEGCARKPRTWSVGLCEMHYYRARRHGDIHFVTNTRKAEVLYRTAHARISTDRGPAATHRCTDCGVPAKHWSYNYSDPNALESPKGQPYSLDVGNYDPRCISCHALFDGWGSNQYATQPKRTNVEV